MNNVVLVGFMGSGKTTVGRELASRLHRSFIDVDDEIAADAGRSIAEIFADEGEAGFRQREVRGLGQALSKSEAVIAAGGGAPLLEENWQRMRDGNTVVALMAEPAEIERRLAGSNGRPLLQPDAPAAIAALLPQRLSRYLAADLVVRTDDRAPADVAARIAGGLPDSGLLRVPIEIPQARHEVTIGSKLAGVVASSILRLRTSGQVAVISDPDIAERHGQPLLKALDAFGLKTLLHCVPPGEPAKEFTVLAAIYHALSEAGVDRQGILIALGGGSVGDVAGFAAATWMRGIRYIQMPTTLLAMVDSSIGGKTAINLPAGKNMAGAIHQPAAIFCDLDYLVSLADADYRASLAEVIKAAIIADRAFVDWLSAHLEQVVQRDATAVREAVARAIAIKAAVVARDAHEAGERAILNFGHTVGHALERVAGYGTLRHGEAVAWGMEVAGRVSHLAGLCDAESLRVQHELLRSAGLLGQRPEVPKRELLQAMRHDKKSRSGEIQWVLLRQLGRAEPGHQVEPSIVSAALADTLGI